MFVSCFHPFQGRPSFGHKLQWHNEYRYVRSFHPFQGRPSFGLEVTEKGTVKLLSSGFHPFQGRPSFGPSLVESHQAHNKIRFPSLSGKTFIRTRLGFSAGSCITPWFPSLSGKTFIRTLTKHGVLSSRTVPGFHPFQGRPSFGLIHATHHRYDFRVRSFHPFQGRPSFGLISGYFEAEVKDVKFPSLSGKTFIRTFYKGPLSRYINEWSFHPFQGRPSFGLPDR